MKNILLIFLILILNSCNEKDTNEIVLMIKNNSNEPISNVELRIVENEKEFRINTIEPNEIITEKFKMPNNKSDVSYSISFFRANYEPELYVSKMYSDGEMNGHNADFIIENEKIKIDLYKPDEK